MVEPPKFPLPLPVSADSSAVAATLPSFAAEQIDILLLRERAAANEQHVLGKRKRAELEAGRTKLEVEGREAPQPKIVRVAERMRRWREDQKQGQFKQQRIEWAVNRRGVAPFK